jgi:superoxide dismutase, Fe-Mn family
MFVFLKGFFMNIFLSLYRVLGVLAFIVMVFEVNAILRPLPPFQPILQIKPGPPNQFSFLDGISQEQIDNHFTFYEEAVNDVNNAISTFNQLVAENAYSSVINSVRTAIPGFYNSMILHEYYFGNLQSQDEQGGTGVTSPEQLEEIYPGVYGTALAEAINRDFGSFKAWQDDFRMGAKSDDVGWMILFADPFLQVDQTQDEDTYLQFYQLDPLNPNDPYLMPACTPRRLLNVFVTLNELYMFGRLQPILVLDMYEHAYLIDQPGVTQEDQDNYITAFYNNIDWTKVAARYNAVCSWGEFRQPDGSAPCAPAITNQPPEWPNNPPIDHSGIDAIEAPQSWWNGATGPASNADGVRQGGISMP